MYKKFRDGWIEVICGCMFAGKTEELIRRITTLKYAKENIIIVKSHIDTRYSKKPVIITHLGASVDANFVENSGDIRKLISKNPNFSALVVDEAQFLDESLVELANEIANQGKKVIIGCLDQDFTGKPFSFIPQLLTSAEFVTKLSAVCVICGNPATKTQRLIDGEPAKTTDPIILISGSDSYEARCRFCHTVL